MKISTRSQNQRGSALLVAVIAAGVMGIMVVSYLDLVSAQNQAVARSQIWNSAIPAAEAGIEEALGQLYYSATNLGVNGWTADANNNYTKWGVVGDSHYFVSISNVSPPVIYSTGFSSPSLGGNPVQRTIRVNTVSGNPFAQGLVAKGSISFNGGGTLDSFDSSDPAGSTVGQYDPAKSRSNAKILTDSGAAGAISVDTAHIFGSVLTGPGGTATCNSGAVGDAAWNGANSGIETGHSSDSANLNFPDVQAPFTTVPFAPGAQNVGGTNYNFAMGSGNYQAASFSLNGNQSMIVYGNATFYVTGDFLANGNGAMIYIAPGASLNLYVAGTCSISGVGVVNGTGVAKNFAVYGMNGCTTCTYSGSSPFVGMVYAPYASFTFSGTAGAIGAFSAASVTINGGANIHCDESLAKSGSQYIVGTWNEM